MFHIESLNHFRYCITTEHVYRTPTYNACNIHFNQNLISTLQSNSIYQKNYIYTQPRKKNKKKEKIPILWLRFSYVQFIDFSNSCCLNMPSWNYKNSRAPSPWWMAYTIIIHFKSSFKTKSVIAYHKDRFLSMLSMSYIKPHSTRVVKFMTDFPCTHYFVVCIISLYLRCTYICVYAAWIGGADIFCKIKANANIVVQYIFVGYVYNPSKRCLHT